MVGRVSLHLKKIRKNIENFKSKPEYQNFAHSDVARDHRVTELGDVCGSYASK